MKFTDEFSRQNWDKDDVEVRNLGPLRFVDDVLLLNLSGCDLQDTQRFEVEYESGGPLAVQR